MHKISNTIISNNIWGTIFSCNSSTISNRWRKGHKIVEGRNTRFYKVSWKIINRKMKTNQNERINEYDAIKFNESSSKESGNKSRQIILNV
jgi:hypothetical protein